ncbi:MAG TPA: Fic family protein [Pseudolabrys sp.]|jgi:cell filamentation protein|nr:Fic family protein [Pseudolabrys sp.]
MYDVEEDKIYCYPGTAVLKNKLDIKDAAVLANFEAEMSNLQAQVPIQVVALDYDFYRALHRHLFSEVYDWAGEPRKIRIGKGGNWFCFPENIDAEMSKLFQSLAETDELQNLDAAEFAKQAAHFMAELNAIHPFREGNGRTQLSFLKLLAERAGHPLDMEKMEPTAVFDAMIESFAGSEDALEKVIAGLL